MAIVTRVSGNAIISRLFDPLMKLITDVIKQEEEDNRQILRRRRITIISRLFDPVMKLITDVIKQEDEDNRQILSTNLRGMESLLRDITTLFRDEVDITTRFHYRQKEPVEIVETWLQLLRNSLTEAERLLSIHRLGRRQSCLDCLVCNPKRHLKEIREWNAFFDHLYHGFQSDLSIMVTSLQFVSSKPLHKEEALLQDVAAPVFVGSEIIDAQAQLERWLHEGDRVRLIGVYGIPGVGKTSLLQMVYDKYYKACNVFDDVIWVGIHEDYKVFDLQRAIADQLLIYLPDRVDRRKARLSAYLKENRFLLVLDGLWSELDLREVGVAFGDDKQSKVLFSTGRKDVVREMGAEESIEIQPLSKDEGWMLFRRVAFKDEEVSIDIEERARKIADECKGLPLAINVVATAMIGQSCVHEWDVCLSSIKNVDPSYPATHPRLDAELYTLLRWGFDALSSSNVKNCFLYCALYKKDEEIDSRQLLQMWIGEGLVKSDQGTHVMDMAIGRKYLKLLLDSCLFQIVKESTDVFTKKCHDVIPSIRVHDLIREMAIYIGQNLPDFSDENCRSISFPNNYIGDLPTDLRCPKIASLIIEGNRNLKELPSEFLLSLTSLRVVNLSGCTEIASVPPSVGQLRLLEFLSLSQLPIKDLPEEICHLSRLQFMDLSGCESLESLSPNIGKLKNLKSLNLYPCHKLKMIPDEISELTSLSRLQLSLETEANIWSLKGLKNLGELLLEMGPSLGIKDGIMGTWSEMRHLHLRFSQNDDSEHPDIQNIQNDLPQDIQNMKKLHSFVLDGYKGSSLPNCQFEHLEVVKVWGCHNIRELSPLERLPNLKLLKLIDCNNLRELGIGSPSGYPRLEKLVLKFLPNLESLGGVWDERTLPHLRFLKIVLCESLKRFPLGMEKLLNLGAIIYLPVYEKSPMEWWESIIWEDENMKVRLKKIFIPRRGRQSQRYKMLSYEKVLIPLSEEEQLRLRGIRRTAKRRTCQKSPRRLVAAKRPTCQKSPRRLVAMDK